MASALGSGEALLRDVAAAAGVSLSTVSKVANGRPDVSSATRVHVQRVLDAHGWVPVARRRRPAVRTVGLVFDDFMSPYATELVRGVTDAGTDLGADVVVGRFPGDEPPGRVGRGWAARLAAGGRDGVLVVTSDLVSSEVEAFEAAGLPLVVIDPVHLPRPGIPSVGATNWSGMLSAVRHLIELGHRRIAYAGGPPAAAVDQARLHGYRAAMESAGLPVVPGLVTHGDFGFEAGVAAAGVLLGRDPRPTAVAAVSDATAMGVVQHAHGAGLRVPDDLSVTGFDDSYLAGWATPPLTAVHAPLQEMGRRALQMVLQLIAGEPLEVSQLELATTLSIRRSTLPPPDPARHR